jgi:hypothetical protein
MGRLDVLSTGTEVGELGVARLQLSQESDHGLTLPAGDTRTVANSDEVAVEHRVDPVHSARRSGGVNEVLGILERTEDYVSWPASSTSTGSS